MNIQIIENLRQRGINVDGDCYRVAADYIIDCRFFDVKKSGNEPAFLVHGIVTGQGLIEGLRYGHAWIETGEEVIDESNGRDIRLPKILYYHLGQVSEKLIRRYSYKEAAKLLLLHEHYGPWE